MQVEEEVQRQLGCGGGSIIVRLDVFYVAFEMNLKGFDLNSLSFKVTNEFSLLEFKMDRHIKLQPIRTTIQGYLKALQKRKDG